jgi:hypothetical protein
MTALRISRALLFFGFDGGEVLGGALPGGVED